MKKTGFTLAEVLITLGIVGVVAALTAPALVQNAGSAQIGPKLAKSISTFEVANENLLSDTGASTILGSGATSGDKTTGAANYIDHLSNYMKINYASEANLDNTSKYASLLTDYNGNKISDSYTNSSDDEKKDDDLTLTPSILYSKPIKILSAAKNIGLMKDGIIYGIYLESDKDKFTGATTGLLTGSTAHKQQVGTLIIDINGYTKPNKVGKDIFAFALMADGSLSPVGANNEWNTSGTECNATKVVDGYTCAGSVLENNLKVIYQ